MQYSVAFFMNEMPSASEIQVLWKGFVSILLLDGSFNYSMIEGNLELRGSRQSL